MNATLSERPSDDEIVELLRRPVSEERKEERIRSFLDLLTEPGDVLELRAFDETKLFGFFDDRERLIAETLRLEEAGYKALYWTPQVLKLELLERCPNQVRRITNQSTKDTDVRAYRYLLVDLDPDRPTDSCSADEELAEALKVARWLTDTLVTEGWPHPTAWGCSGNGIHIYFPMPLEVEKKGLVKRCLKAISNRVGAGVIKADTTVYNPSRIFRVYGTTNRKGESTEARPHRQACLFPLSWLSLEESKATVLTEEILTAFVENYGDKPKARRAKKRAASETQAGETGDGDKWARLIGLEVIDIRGPVPWEGGKKWVLTGCLLNKEHEQDNGACLIEHPDGNCSFRCHHDRCQGKDLGDVRRVLIAQYKARGQELPALLADGIEDWVDPRPVNAKTPPAFPLEIFAPWARKYLEALTKTLQTPPDFAGMFFLGSLSIIFQKRFRLSVKPGWSEVLPLWILLVALSGSRKSQAFREVMKPVNDWQNYMKEEFFAIRRQASRRIKALTAEIEELKRKKAPAHTISEKEEELDELFVPPTPRLFTGSGTPEAIETKLQEHFGRYALATAESDILSVLMGKYRSGGIPPIEGFLSAWSGEDLRNDFQTRDDVDVTEAHLSMVLATQPSNAAELYGQRKLEGRGAFGRFLTVLPLTECGDRWTEDQVPPEVEQAYVKGVRAMLPSFDEVVEAYCNARQPESIELRFSTKALSVFRPFFEKVQARRKVGGDLQFLEEWSAKLCGQCARIAALLHLSDHQDEEVTKEVSASAVERAVFLAEQYLIPHAKAAFGSAVTQQAEKVWEVLQRFAPRVNRRTIQQEVRPMSSAELDSILENLEDNGFLRIEEIQNGKRGRNPRFIEINPRAPESLAQIAQIAQKKASPATTGFLAPPNHCPEIAQKLPTKKEVGVAGSHSAHSEFYADEGGVPLAELLDGVF